MAFAFFSRVYARVCVQGKRTPPPAKFIVKNVSVSATVLARPLARLLHAPRIRVKTHARQRGTVDERDGPLDISTWANTWSLGARLWVPPGNTRGSHNPPAGEGEGGRERKLRKKIKTVTIRRAPGGLRIRVIFRPLPSPPLPRPLSTFLPFTVSRGCIPSGCGWKREEEEREKDGRYFSSSSRLRFLTPVLPPSPELFYLSRR